jgi:excisionase family DNA binding protein
LGSATRISGNEGPSEEKNVNEQQRLPLLSISDVAVRLNVQVRHVRRLVAERRIPYIKWGHLIRFDADELEQWIDSSRRPEAG